MNMNLFRPGAVRAFIHATLPACAVLALLLLLAGLYYSLFNSPPDYRQGETVRIMYVHVPAAWGALLLYVGMAMLGFSAYVWKHAVADLLIEAACPVGAALSLLCLITGSIWGRPMWGAWWVWDARLTSMLILFLLYLGVMGLRGGFADMQRGAKASQLLLVIGLINVPIVKFSVDWWHTLHQPESVFKAQGPSIAPAMLLPLGLMALALFFFCASVIMARYLRLDRQKRSKPALI